MPRRAVPLACCLVLARLDGPIRPPRAASVVLDFRPPSSVLGPPPSALRPRSSSSTPSTSSALSPSSAAAPALARPLRRRAAIASTPDSADRCPDSAVRRSSAVRRPSSAARPPPAAARRPPGRWRHRDGLGLACPAPPVLRRASHAPCANRHAAAWPADGAAAATRRPTATPPPKAPPAGRLLPLLDPRHRSPTKRDARLASARPWLALGLAALDRRPSPGLARPVDRAPSAAACARPHRPSRRPPNEPLPRPNQHTTSLLVPGTRAGGRALPRPRPRPPIPLGQGRA